MILERGNVPLNDWPALPRLGDFAHFRSDPEVCGLDESLFQNLSTAARTLCRLFQNVIRYARICPSNEI